MYVQSQQVGRGNLSPSRSRMRPWIAPTLSGHGHGSTAPGSAGSSAAGASPRRARRIPIGSRSSRRSANGAHLPSRIELDVVDREQERAAASASSVSCTATARARGPAATSSRIEQERRRERSTARRGELRQHFGGGIPQEVAEPRIGETLLAVCGPRGEHTQPALVRPPTRPARGRLADSRLAFEHEGGGTSRGPLDEALPNEATSSSPTNDVRCHLGSMLARRFRPLAGASPDDAATFVVCGD